MATRIRPWVAAVAAFMGAAVAPKSGATEHLAKTVSLLELAATSECYFFQLDGVSEADPSAPNSAWFAIQKAQSNAKEMYALLLSARITGAPLRRVATTNDIVCGASQVATLDL